MLLYVVSRAVARFRKAQLIKTALLRKERPAGGKNKKEGIYSISPFSQERKNGSGPQEHLGQGSFILSASYWCSLMSSLLTLTLSPISRTMWKIADLFGSLRSLCPPSSFDARKRKATAKVNVCRQVEGAKNEDLSSVIAQAGRHYARDLPDSQTALYIPSGLVDRCRCGGNCSGGLILRRGVGATEVFSCNEAEIWAVLDSMTPSWAAMTHVVRAQLFDVLGSVATEPTEVGVAWEINFDNRHVCLGLEPARYRGTAGLGDVNTDFDLGARGVLLHAIDCHPQVLSLDIAELAAGDAQ